MAKREITSEERQALRERLARAREIAAANRAAKAEENPGESAPVEGEQVAPATPDAGARAQRDTRSAEAGRDTAGTYRAEAATKAASQNAARLPLDDEALGALASMVVGNPAWHEAMERVRQSTFKQWADTQALEHDKREALYHLIVTLALLDRRLDQMVTKMKSVRRQEEERSFRVV